MRKIIFILIAIILVAVIILSNNQRSTQLPKENFPSVSPTQTLNKYKTESNSEGAVTIEVTPLVLSTSQNVKFEVALNTHSVPLTKDLKEISTLVDDKGNEYSAISWSGGEGGHHLSGQLEFPPLLKDAKSIKLTIKGIADIDRVFEWSL